MTNGFRFEGEVYEFEDNGGFITAFELPDGRFVQAESVIETMPMGYCDITEISKPDSEAVKTSQRA